MEVKSLEKPVPNGKSCQVSQSFPLLFNDLQLIHYCTLCIHANDEGCHEKYVMHAHRYYISRTPVMKISLFCFSLIYDLLVRPS